MNAFRVLALATLAVALLPAQKKEDFQQIQRDVAQLEDQVRQLQKAQDEKLGALETLVKQSLDSQAKLASALSNMQASLTDTLSQQQQKVVAPVAALSKEVEQMSGDFRAVQSNVGELGTLIRRLDDKLTDISSSIRTLQAQPAPPPPAVVSTTPVPPPGVTAEGLFESARRDYSAKNDKLAMDEFTEYLKYFSETENGPRAQYFVGLIYERAEQYDDAVKAFDAVMERFPPNPFTPDAQYQKAVDLQKGKHNAEAIAEYKEFLEKYPQHEKVSQARLNLRALGVGGAAPPKPNAAKRRAQ